MVLKTCRIESDDIIMTLTDQNGRPSEIEDNWNYLVVNRNDTLSVKPRTRKYVKRFVFLSLRRNSCYKFWKKILNAATKTGLDAVKIASKKEAHKTAEAVEKFIGHKTAEKIVKAKPVSEENLRNVEEIVIPSEKGQKLSELRQVLKNRAL